MRLVTTSIFVLLSFFLTTQAVSVAFTIENQQKYDPLLLLEIGSFRQSALLLAANLLFHFLSCVLAYVALSYLSKQESRWAPIKALLAFLFIGALIAEKAFGAIVSIFNGFQLQYFYVGLESIFESPYWAESLYATSMLIPWAAYFLWVFILFAAKLVLTGTLLVTRRLTFIEAEKKSASKIAPYSLAGLIISVFAAFLKILMEVAKSFSS